MLFGRSEAEKVDEGSLEQMLNSLFEARLGRLGPRANAIITELERAAGMFVEACRGLLELDAEPVTEDLWFVNVNAIKSQKAQYARNLEAIAKNMRLEARDAPNSYERYMDVLARADAAMGEVLKTNANFKQTLYCYSKHLGPFKRSFSEMERLRDSLRQELESRSREFAEYSEAKERISRLAGQRDEITTLGEGLRALRDGAAGGSGKAGDEERGISARLDMKRAEMSAASSEVSRISGSMGLLTMPLERASRKLDHMSLGKRQLHAFISDPVGSIANESDYEEFRSKLAELKEAVEAGRVDVKNKAETVGAIGALADAGIYAMIGSLKSARARRLELEQETMALETAISDLRKGKAASDKAMRDASAMEERIRQVEKERDAAASDTESLFLKYYRKRISIAVG